jgi:uncharacterized protein YdiU (UPF0061 family)
LLRKLVDFCIRRDYPHLQERRLSGEADALYGEWFGEVCERTAVMIAHWMRVGFVHGVMNTDNMSILGLTIDYGPYGWIDDFDPDWTPNTTDAMGRRYRFGWQPKIAYWNLTRLAHAVSPLFTDTEVLNAGLQRYMDAFIAADHENIARKLGLAECRDADVESMAALHALLQVGEVDMTLFFRALGRFEPGMEAAASDALFDAAFYDVNKREQVLPALREWLSQYATRLATDPLGASARHTRMDAANPKYVLRNYLAQQVIDRAEQGDYAGIAELLDVMRKPYDEQPGREEFARRRPDWAREKAGCSMLSCSS